MNKVAHIAFRVIKKAGSILADIGDAIIFGIDRAKYVIAITFMLAMIIAGASAGHEYTESHKVIYEYSVQILDDVGNIVRSYRIHAEYMTDKKEGIKFYNGDDDIELYITKDTKHNIVVKKEGVVK